MLKQLNGLRDGKLSKLFEFGTDLAVTVTGCGDDKTIRDAADRITNYRQTDPQT